MKKSEELGRKTRRMIAKNLIVLAVLAVATVVGVRSWFTSGNPSADATGINVQAIVPETLEIAVVDPKLEGNDLKNYLANDDNWFTNVDEVSLTGSQFDFLKDLRISQVTGDGKTFITPPLLQDSGNIAVAAEGAEWTLAHIQADQNVDYISFDLYMRSKSPGTKIYLSQSKTYFGPVDPDEEFNTNAQTGLPSHNSVIGAARLSVIGSDNSQKLLWIPAPHLYYAYDEVWFNRGGGTQYPGLNSTANTYGLAKARNGSVLTYKYDSQFNGTYNHTYWTYTQSGNTITPVHQSIAYNADDEAAGVTANTEENYTLPRSIQIAAISTQPLSSMTQNPDHAAYKYSYVHFNLWMEGEDPEARAAQVGGEFTVALNLEIQ